MPVPVLVSSPRTPTNTTNTTTATTTTSILILILVIIDLAPRGRSTPIIHRPLDPLPGLLLFHLVPARLPVSSRLVYRRLLLADVPQQRKIVILGHNGVGVGTESDEFCSREAWGSW